MAEYNGYCETGEGAYEYGNESNAGIVGWVNIEIFPTKRLNRSIIRSVVTVWKALVSKRGYYFLAVDYFPWQ